MKTRAVIFVAMGALAALLLWSLLKAEEGVSAQSVNPNFRTLPFVFVHQSTGSDSDYNSVEPKLLVVQNNADYLAAYKATNKLDYRGPTHDIKPCDPDYVYFFVFAGKGARDICVNAVSQTDTDKTVIRTNVRCVISKNRLGFPPSSGSPWCAIKVLRKDVFYFTHLPIYTFRLLGEVRSEFIVDGEQPQ